MTLRDVIAEKNKQKQNGLFNHLDILDEKIVIFAFSRLQYRGFEKAILDLNYFFCAMMSCHVTD